MKKFKIYALLATLAIGMASFSACSSNNNDDIPGTNGEGYEGNHGPDSLRVSSFDQVRFLQDNIVEVDSTGKFVQRVNGMVLNEADTTVLTVRVDSVGAALRKFMSWLSPDTKVVMTTPSAINAHADLTDGDGNIQETVYFKEVGEGNTIAEMSFKKGGVLKHFSKVLFVKKLPMLTDARSPYTVGQTEEYETFTDSKQKWLCVREAKDGTAGLLVYLSKDQDTNWGLSNIGNFASPSLAKAASEAMRADWDKFVGYFNALDRTLGRDDYYWIDDYRWYAVVFGFCAIRLYDGNIDWFDAIWWWKKENTKHCYFIQVRTFGLVNKE